MYLRRYVKIHREDGDVQMEAENGVMLPKPKNTRAHQKV